MQQEPGLLSVAQGPAVTHTGTGRSVTPKRKQAQCCSACVVSGSDRHSSSVKYACPWPSLCICFWLLGWVPAVPAQSGKALHGVIRCRLRTSSCCRCDDVGLQRGGAKELEPNLKMLGPDKRRACLAQKRVGGPRLTPCVNCFSLAAAYVLDVTNPQRSTQLLHPHSTSVPSKRQEGPASHQQPAALCTANPGCPLARTAWSLPCKASIHSFSTTVLSTRASQSTLTYNDMSAHTRNSQNPSPVNPGRLRVEQTAGCSRQPVKGRNPSWAGRGPLLNTAHTNIGVVVTQVFLWSFKC